MHRVKSLLLLTHKQWVFRNARKHIRVVDGMTEEEFAKRKTEQEEERKALEDLAKSKQAELPADSPFRIRVRGAPGEFKIVKI